MFDNKVLAIHQLRVNIKSLAAESKIIRHECRRCGSVYLSNLVEHRRGKLRYEARLAQLCLAFLRGKPYRSVENINSKFVDASDVCNKLSRFIYKPSLKEIKDWLQ